MLIAPRRIALLHISLAAMGALWVTPLVMRLWNQAYAAGWWTFGGLLVLLLLWMVWVDLAARFARTAWGYRLALIGAAAFTFIALLRGLVYPHVGLLDLFWLTSALDRLPQIDAGVQPELVLLGVSCFAWLRTAWATARDLTSLGVIRSFGLSAILLLATMGLLGTAHDLRPFYAAIPLHLGTGFLAVMAAQSDEQAALTHTEGAPLPWGRLAQLGLTVALSCLLAYGLAMALLGSLQGVLIGFSWALEALVVAFQLTLVLGVILAAQAGQWIGRLLRLEWGALSEGQVTTLSELADELQRRLETTRSEDIVLPVWAIDVLRALPLLLILSVVTILAWVVLRRARYRRRAQTAEDAAPAAFSVGDAARQGARRLRDWIDLARRLGVGRQLLAAITVQNIYANVCRIAARLGYPRHPSMPPDTYLPVLAEVFAGYEDELRQITDAYMQVHYGDQPVPMSELLNLQAAYRTIRKRHQI